MGKDQDDEEDDKNNDSGSKHGQEDNTDDVSRDRPVPDRADPNKHDR